MENLRNKEHTEICGGKVATYKDFNLELKKIWQLKEMALPKIRCYPIYT